MTQDTNQLEVYLETGKTRSFAAALDWPGWCRSGRSEASALQALVEYGPRYEHALKPAQLGFRAPSDVSALVVAERVKGNATTDFGAPAISLPRDVERVRAGELARWQAILHACWQTLDHAVDAARGQELRKGPRGGGRELAKIVEHVRDVDQSYLSSLGGKVELANTEEPAETFRKIRQAILAALTDAVEGKLPQRGPRGGQRWTPRYFVRRLAWHELDHAWEIGDRGE